MTEILLMPERIQNLIELGESQFREFKSAYEGKPNNKHPRRIADICKDIAEALVAFANADGGDILIGVEDNGTITGIPFSEEDISVILESPKNYIQNFEQLPLKTSCPLTVDKNNILLLSVDKSNSQIFQLNDGRCMRRYGVTTLPENVNKLLFDQQESISRRFDSEFIDGAQVSDLDFSSLSENADMYIKGMSPEKYLQQLGLAEFATGGLRLRRAALLLFAKDIKKWHSRCQVRILKVQGNILRTGNEYNVTSDELIQGNIFELLKKSWEGLRPFLAYKTQFGGDTGFEQRYIYPEWACREALVNAIAHRDYWTQNCIELFVFDDRMEIKSPGALLSTLKIEQLLKLENIHESRNSLIARCLRERGYMRELGEGMKRIFKLMEENDLQSPELKSNNNSFTVTLFNKSVFSEQQLAWLSLFDAYNLSRLQQRIIVAGMNDKSLSPFDIYGAMNTKDRDTYDKEVTTLRQTGLLIEIMTNVQATNLSKRTGKPKGRIQRFKVVDVSKKYSSEFNNKIIVFGLPLDATNTEIKEIFQKFGLITDIYIPIPKLTYETKYAFVTFQESNTALQAIPPNLGLQLRDFPLTVKLYRSKVG